MRIGLIGGLDRSRARFGLLAARAGVEVLFHDGWMSGSGSKAIEHLIDSCDAIVIVTDLNSHGAVQTARRLLKERGRTPLLLRKCGLSRFVSLLDAARNAGRWQVERAGRDPLPHPIGCPS